MESDKFKEPSFLAASAACILSVITLLLLLTLPLGTTSTSPPDSSAGEFRQLKAQVGELLTLQARLADEMKPMQAVAAAEAQAKEGQRAELEEALSKAVDHLEKGAFDAAHDYLLVASRISATDRRLFDAVVKFIDMAKDSQDDDVVVLAEDLLERAESLVHFQSPKDVEPSLKSLADLRAAFADPPKMPEPEPRSGPIRRLLELASNKDLPVELRSKAAERAKNALDEAMIDSPAPPKEPGDDLTPDRIKEFQKKAEEAEKDCVIRLFESNQGGAAKWLEEAGKLIDEKKNNALTPSALMGEIDKAIARGIDLLQEVVLYVKSGVKGAQELASQIDQRVGSLQRWKIWLYNRDALEKIRVADTKNIAAETGLGSMAKIDESLLAPYVSERYAEVWKKLFDNLAEDKKVEMTKRRVLRTIQ